MTIPTLIYSDYYPTRLQIENLAVRVSEDTLSNLQLGNEARVIIGESLTSNFGNVTKTYGLIVDDQGLGINTTIERRNAMNGQALYIDGDVYITGKIQASNYYPLIDTAYDHVKLGDGDYLDFDGTTLLSGDLKATGLLGGGAGFWLISDSGKNNVYYPGRATIGNRTTANNNTYSFQVNKYADRKIQQAQIAIQNQQQSHMRFGILGNGIKTQSPGVINTNTGTKLEFHVGRDSDYFDQMYSYSNYDGYQTNQLTGETVPYLSIESLDAPDYTLPPGVDDPSLAPHMQIDESGNVGIHTSMNREITYTSRIMNPTRPTDVIFPQVTESAALHIEGTTYSKTYVVYDPETTSSKSIDELYVRKLGVTFDASQIKPGTFGAGDYSFTSNMNILGNLNVNMRTHTRDLEVDDRTVLNHLIANDTVVFKDASFCNDMYVMHDLIVKDSLRVNSGIFTPVINTDGSTRWQAIQFQAASPDLSNINYMGNGLTTPGKFGTGINPYTDDVLNQFTVIKHFADTTYEIEVVDKSSSNYTKAAFIGHPTLAPDMGIDASLIIATPKPTDPDYILNNDSIPQNIYFFPGWNLDDDITRSKPPTFGIFAEGTIGVGTYIPRAKCDIRGSLMFSDKLIYNDTTNNQQVEIGLWKTTRRVTTSSNQVGEIVGIQYLNPSAPRVAINTAIDTRYALNIGGKMRAIEGYYTNDNKKGVLWLDGDDLQTTSNYSSPLVESHSFTYTNVGIGVTQAMNTLELKNNYGSETVLKLYRGDNDTSTTSVEFAGINPSWIVKANDIFNRFEIGRGSNTFLADDNIRPFWTSYSTTLDTYQTFINCDINALNKINRTKFDPKAALTVNGSMNVLGDVHASGLYKIDGVIQVYNSNMGSNINSLGLGDDDVFIGGRHIILNPGATKTVMIGVPPQDDAINAGADKDSLLRLYQPSLATSNAVVCSMRSAGSTALISLIAENSRDSNDPQPKQLKFGVFNPSDNNGNAFKFVDEQDRPYITFQTNGASTNNVSERYVGFNTDAPSAMLHVSTVSSGSNMLKLTKVVSGPDASSTAPCIELERLSDTSHKWNITGPMYGQERLGFVYQDDTKNEEVFSFTNSGRIGIGSSDPQYSLDIHDADGQASIRVWNEGDNAFPQLIFQSGQREFGADSYTDYMMYSFSNNYKFVSENVIGDAKTIMHVDDTGKIGIGTNASSNYDVQVIGDLNVTSRIYVNGSLLFDSAEQGSTAAATNFTAKGVSVLIRPDPLAGGGVVVNGRVDDAYGNLLHVYSGADANMAVFDSTYNDLQLNFRTRPRTGVWNTYRMGVTDEQMYWEYNTSTVYNGKLSDSHNGYNKMLFWQPSARTSNEFDMTLSGCLNLVSSNASVTLGNSGYVSSSNGSVCVTTSSNMIGLGTTLPTTAMHVYTSNSYTLLQQAGSGDILRLRGRSNTDTLIVDTNGNVGVRTSPRAALDINDGQVFTAPGTSNAPSYTFAVSPATGMYLASNNTLGLVTNNRECMRINSDGSFVLGRSNLGNSFLSVSSNTSTPLVSISQQGSGDILRVSNSNLTVLRCRSDGQTECRGMTVTGSVVPSADSVYDLGTSNARWRDLYLSGNSLDIQGTRITRSTTGDLRIGDSSNLKDIIVNQVNIGNTLLIQKNAFNQVTFSSIDSNTGQIGASFTPLTANNATSAISIGTVIEDATMHLTTSNVNFPTLILEQFGACNLVQMKNGQSQLVTITNQGNIGIGTMTPRGPIDVNTSNTTSGLFVTQSNLAGNIITLANSAGPQVVVTGSGRLGVNTSNPQAQLHVIGQQVFDGRSTFTSNVMMNANLEIFGNAVTHGNAITDSDSRLKTDLQRIDNALEKVHKLTGYTFMRINDAKRSTGLVAQEVLDVLPEAVDRVSSYHYGVAYGNMMGLIVEAIKELTAEVRALKESRS